MSPDSVILIDEKVLPEMGVHWQATSIDITMMMAGGAIERTEEHWNRVLHSAGFKAKKVWRYTKTLTDSVIVAVPL